MKKYQNTVIFATIVFLFWQMGAMYINNTFILPTPILVIQKMISQIQQESFFNIIGLTVFRTMVSIVISFVIGVGFAFFSTKNTSLESVIKKLILLAQSIPNVTFIILFMFWFSKESIVFFVSFLLLFPVVFQNTIHTLKDIQNEWSNVIRIYPQNKGVILHKVYIPMLKPIFKGTLSSCVSMGFKVGVMAEILSQVHNGIGRSMQLARLDVDLAGVIGWTVWLFICVFLCEKIVQKLIVFVCR